MERQCQGRTKAEQPCRAPANTVRPSGFCPAHDAANVTAFRDQSARGGRGKATARRVGKLVPATLKPVIGTLLAALDEVRDGTLSPGQASAMAALASAVVRLYQTGVLEERLASLEAAHEARQGGRMA